MKNDKIGTKLPVDESLRTVKDISNLMMIQFNFH